MKKYLEIVAYENEEVIRQMDVTEKTDREIDKIESGLNINLNHSEYFTRLKTELHNNILNKGK